MPQPEPDGSAAVIHFAMSAMRGYADLGMQHIIFQCEPYTQEALRRLTEALHLYRGMKQP